MTQTNRRHIEAEISGLKCDTVDCDYRDNSIQAADYESYVNAPCPKCGASLLTPDDYAIVKHTLLVTEFINGLSDDRLSELIDMPVDEMTSTETGILSMELDGTGEVSMTLSKNEPKEDNNP